MRARPRIDVWQPAWVRRLSWGSEETVRHLFVHRRHLSAFAARLAVSGFRKCIHLCHQPPPATKSPARAGAVRGTTLAIPLRNPLSGGAHAFLTSGTRVRLGR